MAWRPRDQNFGFVTRCSGGLRDEQRHANGAFDNVDTRVSIILIMRKS